MAIFRGTTLTLGFAASLLLAAMAACSDDAADSLRNRPGGSSGGVDGDGGTTTNANGRVPEEERLFRTLEANLQKQCGNACHAEGTYKPQPATFLAGPDAYKSIKAHPGIVTRDVFQSALLTKGAHAGPALNADPEFEKKVVAWLEAESLAIRSQKLPTTPATPVQQGPNDVDLTPICTGGLSGVHLKFDASLVGSILQLSNVKVVAPAGKDVHILQPKFYRVLAEAKPDGTTDVADPADSFSNSDQTVPGGAETLLSPGTVLFSGEGWRGFDFAKDKLRIEAVKMEQGKVSVLQGAAVCKNPTLFATNVLPSMRGQGGITPNCSQGQCHANGLAGLALAGADTTLICNQVLAKLNAGNIGQSLIITKVTQGPHNGGTVNNAATWTALFTQNAGAFF